MILEACHCNSRVMEASWWAGDFTSLSTQSFSSQETPQSQEKLDRWSSYDNYLFHILSLSLLFTMLCKLETWLDFSCCVVFAFFLSFFPCAAKCWLYYPEIWPWAHPLGEMALVLLWQGPSPWCEKPGSQQDVPTQWSDFPSSQCSRYQGTLGTTCTLLEQAQASITIYSPPCKCGQGQLLAGEEDVEGTWINELGIWISVHTLTSSLGRGSGWRERGEWSQHLDPALIPAPALFPRSCPDFPSLLRRLHLNLAFCKTLKGAFVKMGGYFLFHSWLDWFIIFR